MSQLKQLTVQYIKDRYWDSKLNIGKPIRHYIFQSYDGLDIDDKIPTTKGQFPEIFTPDGSLKHERDSKVVAIYKNWLSNGVGPYKMEDSGKSKNDFYYLGGVNEHGEHYWYQICSGPLNVVSTDCMDEVNLWIVKS